jgi:hypothetical protein
MSAPDAVSLGEAAVNLPEGRLVAAVVRLADGQFRIRFGRAGGAGYVLSGEQALAVRGALGDALGMMFEAERRNR